MIQAKRPEDFKLPANTLNWMIGSLMLVIAPHLFRVELWVPLCFLALAGWRYTHNRYDWKLPNGLGRFLLAISILVGVVISYKTLMGRDAGVALLIGLVGLKLIEMRSLREAMLVCFLSYFLIITNFLFSQDIPMALYLILVMLTTTATLISLSDQKGTIAPQRRLRMAGVMLLQAIPLMLVLFVLFPRIEGSLWGLPKDAFGGRTGLDDSMSPGTISSLSLSDAVAFRVNFGDSPIPPQSKLYWRGPVLLYSDGKKWTGSDIPWELPKDNNDFRASPIEYSVTLEPHEQPWLYALDMADPIKDGKLTRYYHVRTRNNLPIRDLTKYQIRSWLDYRARVFSKRFRYRMVGDGIFKNGYHPQAKALGESWRKLHPDPENPAHTQAIVNTALQYFNENPFIYTLRPPLLLRDHVDDFLFDTRRGFCEHYAAAFTVLMWAADIPARVVTGYQGGEVNPFGFVTVRQRDAHAWSEVWMGEDLGWQRVDPTSAVSPERIESGIDSALPNERFNPLGFQISTDSPLFKVWEQVRFGWDALNSNWDEWVLGYGAELQGDLMTYLGLRSFGYQGLLFALLGAVITLMSFIAFWLFWHQPRRRREPLQAQYERFCHKLARKGIERQPSEGPLDLAARIHQSAPELTEKTEPIINLYVQMRYCEPANHDLNELKQAVNQFS